MASEADREQRYCPHCRKTMAGINFYTLKSGEKSDMCKSCETMHINNWDPETFLWLLERYDVPYIPAEWDVLRDRAYQKDPYKMTGMSVFGKYLSKMKLKQWKGYGYADSAQLQAEAEEKARQYGPPQEQTELKIAEMKEAFENGEISESQFKTYVNLQERKPEFIQMAGGVTTAGPYPINDNPFEKVDLPDVGADLSDEDKIYLAMKWGRLYSSADWVSLEKMYQDYENSFSLHNADLIRGTIQLCKLDLKGNQALDSGDMDSYSKIARASDALRKSLKFTEAQRKEERKEDFDAFGLIVSFVEKNNPEDYIKPIDLSIDRDIVDRDIRDIKNSTKQLVQDDPTVFKMIEQYIKKREALAEEEKYKAEVEDGAELSDEDFRIFSEQQELLKQLDILSEEDDE